MAATQTPRRRNRSTKAEQDKAQREAKAAEAAKRQTDEASEAELAAQAQRPSNEPEAGQEPEQPAEPEKDPEQPETPAEPSGFKVGEVTTLPSIERSSSRASVWTDRLNDAAEKLEAAGFPDKGCVPVLECATPRTAANTANNVRVKINADKVSGLLDGMYGENGKLKLVTRGRAILVAMNPDAPKG